MEEQLMDGMMHFVSIFIMRNVPLSSLCILKYSVNLRNNKNWRNL